MTGSSIFICYRRDDSAPYARTIYTDLRRLFGDERVFMDVGVELGADFVERVERQIAACAVLLVVIGPDWSTMTDKYGNRRLDDPGDLVRREIETALARGDVIVIPLFVDDARMPRADELPPSLAALHARNGLALRDDGWDDDVAALVRRLRAVPAFQASDSVKPKRGMRDHDRVSPTPGPSLASRMRAAGRPAFVALALVLLGAIALASLLLAGGGDAKPEVRIGAIYTLTHEGASAGRESLNGVKLAADYLNDKRYPDLGLSLAPGQGVGRAGAKLVVKVRDVAGDRCKAQPAFDGLVKKDGVVAAIGAYESTVTQQAIVAAEKLRVPLVNDTATAYGLTSDDKHRGDAGRRCGQMQEDPTPSKWFARVGGNDEQFAGIFEGLIKSVRHDRGVPMRKIAILYEGHDSFGTSGLAVTKRLAARQGLQWRRFKYLRSTARDGELATSGCPHRRLAEDLDAQVTRLKRYRPDIVFALSYLEDAVMIVQTMSKRSYTPPAMLAYGNGYADPRFIASARTPNRGCGLPAADPRGIITRSSGGWPAEGVAAQRVAKLFEQRFGQPMTDTTARSFTATMALATAIHEAESTDPEDIRRAIRLLEIPPGATILPGDGGIRFDRQGQNEGVRGFLQQIFAGGYATVYPRRNRAERPAVWPLRSTFN